MRNSTSGCGLPPDKRQDGLVNRGFEMTSDGGLACNRVSIHHTVTLWVGSNVNVNKAPLVERKCCVQPVRPSSAAGFPGDFRQQHHHNVEDLLASAAADCYFCLRILTRLRENGGRRFLLLQTREYLLKYIFWKADGPIRAPACVETARGL